MTKLGRPDDIVSRANISPISDGFGDSATNMFTTTFKTSMFPVDVTALAHLLTNSQFPKDDVLLASALNKINKSKSQRQIASKNSPSLRILSGFIDVHVWTRPILKLKTESYEVIKV